MRTNTRSQGEATIITDYYPDVTTRLHMMVPITKQVIHTSAATHKADGVTMRIFERRVAIKYPGVQPPHLTGVKRGLVDLEFSGKARKRMINTLHQWRIPRNFKTYFITLTYPKVWPKNWQAWKQDLEAFRRKLIQCFPEAQGFWRLELQQRGAPHYHLVIAMPRGLITNRRIKSLVRLWWAKIAHSDDQHQGKYATRVDVMQRQSAIYKYISKYVSKPGGRPVDDDGVILSDQDAHREGTQGRHWGKIQKPSIDPIAEFDMLSVGATQQLKAVVVGWLRGQGAYYADYLQDTPPDISWDCVGLPGLALLLIIDDLRIGAGLLPHERARVLSTA